MRTQLNYSAEAAKAAKAAKTANAAKDTICTAADTDTSAATDTASAAECIRPLLLLFMDYCYFYGILKCFVVLMFAMHYKKRPKNKRTYKRTAKTSDNKTKQRT